MVIRTTIRQPKWSEVTPKSTYLNRRRFLTAAAGALWLPNAAQAGTKLGPLTKSRFSTDEKVTPFNVITTYNNFYEFGTDKDNPAQNAHTLKTSPWSVVVEGHVAKPKTFDLNEILKFAPLEERIYRMRCVEGWSIVVPWIGFPVNELLKRVEPTSKAKYVAFETLWDAKQMPKGRWAGIDFPYREGLRLDEAMHPLAILSFGLYGEVLPNQNGAPIRLVVPWKYGFKSIKSIARIRLVAKEPNITWRLQNSQEYGFYSNVNPEVDHPRWRQNTERRLGEIFRRQTLMFNGYGEHVAHLYNGMDLRKFY